MPRPILDNTLLIFLSDNGACPYHRLRGDEPRPGPPGSGFGYDARWAQACNAPLRKYKQYAHAGGTATPLIVHWPARITARGKLSRVPGHVVDVLPTLIEAAQGADASNRDTDAMEALPGESLLAAFQGEALQRRNPIYWEFGAHHAVREANWKLVAERGGPWELYDLDADPCEVADVAAAHPSRVARLAGLYEQWAARTGALPHERAARQQPSKQSQLFDLHSPWEQAAGSSPVLQWIGNNRRATLGIALIAPSLLAALGFFARRQRLIRPGN